MKITKDQLKGACEDQLKLFQVIFPEGASFNSKEEAIELARSVAHKFDFGWAAQHFLRGEFLASYEKAEASLWAAYLEAMAPIQAAYEEAMAPSLAAYLEAKAPLSAAYKEAMAKLFAELYWEQGNES